MLCCTQGCNITHIKLIRKSLIYSGGALKFSVQSPNYAGVLDEIVYFFLVGVAVCIVLHDMLFTIPILMHHIFVMYEVEIIWQVQRMAVHTTDVDVFFLSDSS